VKIAKRIAIAFTLYVFVVVAFEVLIGVFQPSSQATLTIATQDESGHSKRRVLARIKVDEQLYVAANHWPRAWYNQAISTPDIEVALDRKGEEMRPFRAVPIVGEARNRIDQESPLTFGFRFLTGFAPRTFLRLDPL
jgi:hypothetical protein